MHHDNIEWADDIDAKRNAIKEADKKLFKAGDDRCPAETWKGYLYHDGTHVVIPQDNFASMLMKAGARVTLKGKTTYKSLTQSSILFEQMYMAFFSNGTTLAWKAIDEITGDFKAQADRVKALGFRLFMKRAAIGQAKHVRVRPRFEQWSVEGSFEVIDDAVTDDVLQRIWEEAGKYIGLCDWRPGSKQSPGPYGRFVATLKKV